jgi:hypothetical protein
LESTWLESKPKRLGKGSSMRVATLLLLEMGAVSLGRPVFGVLYSNESRERR